MIVKFSSLQNVIVKSASRVIKKHAGYLRDDLKSEWPVKTGASRAGWRVVKKGHGYAVRNNVKSPEGYDYVPGLWYGRSSQMPLGGDPILARNNFRLMKALRGMKFKV